MKRLGLIMMLLSGCDTEPPASCAGCIVLYDVTIIDGLGNPPAPNQAIVVSGEWIRAIEPVENFVVPPNAEMRRLSGRYVIPGLIDMHAHVTILPMDPQGQLETSMDRLASEEVLRTLLDFGITTIRNPAAPAEDGVALRDAVADGSILGPEILTAGNTLNLSSSNSGPNVSTPTEAAVVAEVRRQARIGVDFIKVYGTLPPDLVAVSIREAHAQNLSVIGHLQNTTWSQATRLGIDHITHGAPWSATYLPASLQTEYRGTLKDRIFWLAHVDFDGVTIQEMIQVMADSNVTVDPTLIAYRTKFFGDDLHYLASPDSIYVPVLLRDIWRHGTFTSDWMTEDYARGHAVWPRVLDLTRRLFEAGVLLTAGSDLPNPWVIPGASLHEELKLLHDAGIPTLAVLKIATHNGAVSMGLEDRIGAIEVGKEADLVVLQANPLDDLSNTRKIEYVFVNGIVHEGGRLTK